MTNEELILERLQIIREWQIELGVKYNERYATETAERKAMAEDVKDLCEAMKENTAAMKLHADVLKKNGNGSMIRMRAIDLVKIVVGLAFLVGIFAFGADFVRSLLR